MQAVLTALGFITKVKEKTMTNDDWSQFYTNYKAQFGITLEEDNAIADEPPAAPESLAAPAAVGNSAQSPVESATNHTGTATHSCNWSGHSWDLLLKPAQLRRSSLRQPSSKLQFFVS